MTTVTVHHAKTHLSKLIAAAERGEEVVIARGNKPAVRLEPLARPADSHRRFGLLKGKGAFDETFFDPLPEDELALWNGGRRLKLLLDTHALLWWVFADERFPKSLRQQIDSPANIVHVSAVSAMEITTKHRIGKLPQAEAFANDFASILKQLSFQELPISVSEAVLAGRMSGRHKDPFDRLLIAQALLNDHVLVSNERLFDDFGVKRLW